MTDAECVVFLQWALPRLGLRWAGFRRVRRQVCKRLKRRLVELALRDANGYRSRLMEQPSEWRHLEDCCRISISRFCRDRQVFAALTQYVVPTLAQAGCVEAWSIGCASGEEPYTLRLIWTLGLKNPDGRRLRVLATDTDARLLQRARVACYPSTCLGELSPDCIAAAFRHTGQQYCLRAEFRNDVELVQQDIRKAAPERWFHLILCRNLVFTYFDTTAQREALDRIVARLLPGGALVLGKHEHVPGPRDELVSWFPHLNILRRA